MSSGANVVIDIETVPVPLTPQMRDFLLKSYRPPKTWKDPEKIAEHREEFLNDLDEEGGFKVYQGRPISVAMGISTPGGLVGLESKFSEDGKELGLFVRNYLAEVGVFRLVGANLNSFDLHHLAHLAKLSGKPWVKRLGKWSTLDLLEWPLKYKYRLKEACLAFGINIPEHDGGDVAGLYAAGRFDEIEHYNREDIRITHELLQCLAHIYDL